MQYSEVVKGKFIARPNRFIASVDINGHEETVHVKNTGRCRELLVPGANVLLEKSKNPQRRTQYSLIAVYKGRRLINMDSQAPNAVAEEALKRGAIQEIGIVEFCRREAAFGDSRFDLYYEKDCRKGFIEVKGVTLEEKGIAFFPDAPTQRGARHLRELCGAVQAGYEAAALFLIQMEGIRQFWPNTKTDPDFSLALLEARSAGVRLLAYGCRVEEARLVLDKPVDFPMAFMDTK